MISKTNAVLFTALLLTFPVIGGRSQDRPQAQGPANVALLNGQWFNGKSFEPRTVYSVKGRFTFMKPARIDRTGRLAERAQDQAVFQAGSAFRIIATRLRH